MILFMAIAHTLAKDLRDLENDRAGGKMTTPVYFGPKSAAVVSFIFSVTGLIFWATPYFTIYKTDFILKAIIILVVVLWNVTCFLLCKSIYRNYTKGKARKLHKGFILTFTIVLSISFLAGVI